MLHLPVLAVTAYCERTGPGFWAEPLNATSNAGFLLVSMVLMLRLRRQHYPLSRTWDLWLLCGLIGITGIGSFLWHTYAKPWAEWLDVIPILVYISIYLVSFLLRVAGLSVRKTIVWFVTFHLFNILFVLTIHGTALNGSIFYIPSMAMLMILIRYDRKLTGAAIFFVLGLFFRTIDHALCPYFPLGTHFLWHLLICITVYMTTGNLINIPARDLRKNA